MTAERGRLGNRLLDSPRVREMVRRRADLLVWIGYNIHVEGFENLQCLENPNIPIILIFNHRGHDDSILTAGTVVSGLNHYADPTGRRKILPYTDMHDVNPEFQRYLSEYDYLGWEPVPVYQAYWGRVVNGASVNDQRLNKKPPDPRELIKDMLIPGAVTVISTEGHRAENGALGPSENIIGRLAMHLLKEANGLVIPVAIIPEKTVFGPREKTLLHLPRSKYTLKIGQALTPDDILKEGTDLMLRYKLGNDAVNNHILAEFMGHVPILKIRDMLPKEMRGVYNSEDDMTTFYKVLNGLLKYGIRSDTNSPGLVVSETNGWKNFNR